MSRRLDLEELIRQIQELTANSVPTRLSGPPTFEPYGDPAAVSARFRRADAQEFYTRFNPRGGVVIDWFFGDLEFYDFDQLDEGQLGYAFTGSVGKPERLSGWPEGMLVVAVTNADPCLIDPAKDGEVHYAIHGTGEWRPLPIAANLADFLRSCIAWSEMTLARGDTLLDEDEELHPDSWAKYVELALAAGIEQRYLDNMELLA